MQDSIDHPDAGMIQMNPHVDPLKVRLLGRFEVWRNGSQVQEDEWERRNVKSLLALLLLERGHVLTYDALIERLFEGSDPEKARSSLYSLASRLRRTLEPNLDHAADSTYILRRSEGYCFNVKSRFWLDTAVFHEHLGRGEERQLLGRHAEAIEQYEAAIRLCRGQLLEDFRYEEWALEPRDKWLDEYVSALTQLADAYAHLGDYHRAAVACSEAFNLQPWRESVLRQLMSYHYMAGERSEALQIYRRGIEALKQQLDVEPSAETEVLRQQVLDRAFPEAEGVRDKTRIAVLPLVNMSPDPQDEYFADGMTEELIYALSQVRDLKVIAQTSVLAYKNTKKTVAQIGRELSLGTVIEGSVRKAGDMIRITVQLIDVGSEEHLWAQEYDWPFSDVFAIQSNVAREVAQALRVELLDEAAERLDEEPTTNLEAYTLYLKGRRSLKTVSFVLHYRTPRLEKAIECFSRALEVDPDYALAWSGLADAFCLSWFYGNASDERLSRADEAAGRAVELDPTLAEGHASQALVQWIGRRQLDEAERLFRKAIDLAPRKAILHRWYGRFLNQLDRKGEALVEALKAHEIDPLSAEANLELSNLFLFSRRREDGRRRSEAVLDVDPKHEAARLMLAQSRMLDYDWEGAEAEYLRAIEDDPTSASPHLEYAELLVCLGRRAEGETALKRGLALAGEPRPSVSLEQAGIDYFALGDIAQALRMFKSVIAVAPRVRLGHWWSAVCHWRLGNHDDAFAALEQAEEANAGFHQARRLYMTMYIHCVSGMLHAGLGNQAEAEHRLEQIRGCPDDLIDRSVAMAAVLFHLGEIDEGLVWLQRSVDAHDMCLRRSAYFDLPKDVVSDPRFATIYRQTGLPIEALRESC